MNTRRKLLLAKPTIASEKWHLMHEPYEPCFARHWKEHVEEWYNLCATGVQREHFRSICMEMYKLTETDKTVAEYKEESLSKYNAFANKTEIDLLLSTYGKVFTELGVSKARLWLRTIGITTHHRNLFRNIFGACQAVFINNSTMKEDYTPIDPAVLNNINREHLHKSVDWFRIKNVDIKSATNAVEKSVQKQENKKPLNASLKTTLEEKQIHELCEQEDKEHLGEPCFVLNSSSFKCDEVPHRFTKPKSQFDGVNYLSTVGYGSLPLEQAVCELKKKRAAYLNNDLYFTVPDEHASNDINAIFNKVRNNNNCTFVNLQNREKSLSEEQSKSYTVYKAGNAEKSKSIAIQKGTCDLTRGVYTEPMSEWTLKTLEWEIERAEIIINKVNKIKKVNNV